MKKILLLIFVFQIVCSFSQDFTILQQKSIGGLDNDFESMLLNDPHNPEEYFLITTSSSDISGDKTDTLRGGTDIWLLKLDNNFDVLWDKTYGGYWTEIFMGCLVTDNHIILQVASNSNTSGEKTMDVFTWYPWEANLDIWVLCLDFSGNIVWQNQYGGVEDELESVIVPHTDSTFAMFITSMSPASGNKTIDNVSSGWNVWCVEAKYDGGDIVRESLIGNSSPESISSSIKIDNGHFLLMVATHSSGSVGYGNIDVRLVELDENLEFVRDKYFGGENSEGAGNIIESNGYYYLSTYSTSGISGNKTEGNYGIGDVWLLKINQDFDIVWQKTIGGNSTDLGRISTIDSNGKLVLSIDSSSDQDTGNKTAPNYGGMDKWIVLMSENGDVLEQFTVGGDGFDAGKLYPHPTESGKLIFCLTTTSENGTGNKTVNRIGGEDSWIGVIDASNVLNVQQSNFSKNEISVSPNPASESIVITIPSTEAEVVLIDLNGRSVSDVYHLSDTLKIDVGHLNQGIYFVTVIIGDDKTVLKLVVN